MVESAATDKLTRWISKRETFTRRDAFLGTKGGVMRNVSDFDTALNALVTDGLIALALEQPIRGIRYVVVLPSDETPHIRSFSPVVASTPAHVEATMAEPRVAHPTESSVSIPLTVDEVLRFAASLRNHNGRCDYLLEQIEQRHANKRAGDLLRADELNVYDQRDLKDLRICVGMK